MLIAVNGTTTGWTPALYTGTVPDCADDQATAIPEADLVGDLSHAAFYMAFDDASTPSLTDGVLGFRIRIGAEKSPARFSQVATGAATPVAELATVSIFGTGPLGLAFCGRRRR